MKTILVDSSFLLAMVDRDRSNRVCCGEMGAMRWGLAAEIKPTRLS